MDFLESAVNYLNFHETGAKEPDQIIADAITSIAYSLAGILEALNSCPECESEMLSFESWEQELDDE
ncbi:hypothetical protein [Mycobacteroides immunogenum]|uniref:Uncharacterized protein n=1 Tax=Mycobacteroides immunogenum TaxID=83262 RepID=A0A7V8LQZ3_9MYCO|nr:hypothetical protein [Mycobacteroides immunogenum]KPG13707.1 hypothetical protein AN909_05425 [Mycobacteroides immunogenum]KPG14304.1 hypothetical protein AN908_06980 [Mycobacteroides immunogenum]KPG14372.1 hypothetical protein AN908_07435 [Mycobacteroides immunogenum]KPG17421.1 hypothetical protein AN910_04650 [Mycobacteroides immunogenum]KPG23995.1 hypothetical protein AN911_00510 [Mycobacteroides immunogenum]